MYFKIPLLIFYPLASILCDTNSRNDTNAPIAKAIIGGKPADINNFPFLVSMQYRLRFSWNTHRCCGFLLTPLWVGTAAHCLVDINGTKEVLPTKLFFLIAGTADIINWDVMHQTRFPTSFVPHPEFSWSMLYNDIGLIKVDKPFDYNENIGLAILPNFNFHLEAWKSCVVAGWGTTDKSNSKRMSDKLMYTELKILPQELCVWGAGGSLYLNPSGSICTDSDNGKKDACKGDSGSSLICDLPHIEGDVLDPELVEDWLTYGWSANIGRQRKVVGIVSWSWACARSGIPGIYTDIRNYRGWLSDVVHNSNSSIDIMKYFTFLVILVHLILADFGCL